MPKCKKRQSSNNCVRV